MSFGKQLLLADLTYSAWASRRLLDACSALTAEEVERDQRISHTSIFDTLQHIHDGEKVWLACVRDTPDLGTYLFPVEPSAPLPLNELRQTWPVLSEDWHRWLQDQSESSLCRELTIRFPGVQVPFQRWKILRHMLDHSQFHRGQVVGMIRALGYIPPAINRMDHYQVDEGNKAIDAVA